MLNWGWVKGGTIEAMSKLPKAAMDAANKNSTKPEEREAADDKLYSLFRLPADIMTQIAEDAGYIDEEKEEKEDKSTIKPWIVTKKKKYEEMDDHSENDDEEEYDTSGSFTQAKPHQKKTKRRRKHKKEPKEEYDEDDGLISLNSIFKQPTPASNQQQSTISPIAPLPTFFPPMSFIQETTTVSPPPPHMTPPTPRLAYQQVVRDGKTYYEPVYILPPVAGMPLPTLSSVPSAQIPNVPTLTDAHPPIGVPILSKDTIIYTAAPTPPPSTTPSAFPTDTTSKPVVMVDSVSHSFSPPTFPPPINLFQVAEDATRKFTGSSLFTTQQPPVSEQTEQTELYAEEVTVTRRPVQFDGNKKYKSTLARIPVDKHYPDRHEEYQDNTETEDQEPVERRSRHREEDLRNREDREMEDDEEIPRKPKKVLRNRKRKTVRRLKVPLDDDNGEYYPRRRMAENDPPVARRASDRFVNEFNEFADDSEVDVELEKRKLHKRLLEGGMKRRRVHAAMTYNVDDEKDKRHERHGKYAKDKVNDELENFEDNSEGKQMRRITIKRQRLRSSEEREEERRRKRAELRRQLEEERRIEDERMEKQREEEEEREREMKRSRERRRLMKIRSRNRRRMQRKQMKEEEEDRRKGGEEDTEQEDGRAQWDEITTTTPANSYPLRRRSSSRSRERIMRERKSRERNYVDLPVKKYKKKIPFQPSRAHCLNIRSFARQFGILDAIEFATTHCEFIENYYPELQCSDTADYMRKCEEYYYSKFISNLDFAEMQISIELTFREKWTDPRLILGEENDNFQIGGNDENYITLTDISQIWKPDSFFQEEKESHLHSIDVPNVFARIYPNGSITYSQRISLVISCPMYLHDYPLDVQRCPLSIASYGYTTEDITYVWKKNDPIQLYPKLKSSLPNFKISDISINNCSSITNTGTYSCIQLTIEFHRRSGYYIFHIFIPSALLVIVSCLSFWMHHSAVPARVSLGLLTLLTIITQAASLEHNMPSVNYLKAMDLWLGMCLSFAFFAVLELGIVSFISTFEYPSKIALFLIKSYLKF
ncbi:hypothetical protein WR25_16766 isoform B [Diploscapter pachys]|uniref:Ig-like domain-containing protein n=2 Tax=Diploscapter pachys TaxID=2018661 RepID=A0A2A2L827_9BILA|nr:hypothetical protein WR25_16766 isoform A [Diploscapter pachys]PAV82330.1 hypothetical protein WR25_16766 isoform B [Diploscapter pachys]